MPKSAQTTAQLQLNSAVATGLEKVSFIPVTRKGNAKECSDYHTIAVKLSSGHRTGKGEFSFLSQRKAMPKSAQTTVQLQLSHTLVK